MKSSDATIKTIANITQTPCIGKKADAEGAFFAEKSTEDYSPEAVKSLIKRLKLNEKAFALIMNVSPMTVKLWTSGAAKPCNLSKRLMQLYDICPEAVDKLAAGGDSD